MPDFGFAIKKPRNIDLDKVDLELLMRLYRREPSFKRCFQCGNCSAVCSAASHTDFNIRRVHTAFRRGNYQDASKELRKCMLCGKCTLVCPRGVNLRNLIIQMRKLSENTDL